MKDLEDIRIKDAIKESRQMINICKIFLDVSLREGNYSEVIKMEGYIRRTEYEFLRLEGMEYIFETAQNLSKRFGIEKTTDILSGIKRSLANPIDYDKFQEAGDYGEYNERKLDDLKIFIREYVGNWVKYQNLLKKSCSCN